MEHCHTEIVILGSLVTRVPHKQYFGMFGPRIEKLVEGVHDNAIATIDDSESDEHLKVWRADYDKWDQAMKSRYPWAHVRNRLLTDTAENGEPLLEAANGLVEPVFFGMDIEGNPLFADGKMNTRDLPYCGLTYEETMEAVCFKKDSDGKQVKTGYRMFQITEDDNKSPEILQFENFIGAPFVNSGEIREFVSSWVESRNVGRPQFIRCNPFNGEANIYSVNAEYSNPNRGVRRLLRGHQKA